MSASMSHGASAEPNLTPMLDMVFQLITFFMLIVNFKGAEMDLTLKLPVLGSARPVETKGAEETLLVLNINAEGKLKLYNVEQDVTTYIKKEATSIRNFLRAKGQLKESKDGPPPLPVTVVVRADKRTRFELLNKVIRECQLNGFQYFSLKAMTKVEQ